MKLYAIEIYAGGVEIETVVYKREHKEKALKEVCKIIKIYAKKFYRHLPKEEWDKVFNIRSYKSKSLDNFGIIKSIKRWDGKDAAEKAKNKILNVINKKGFVVGLILE